MANAFTLKYGKREAQIITECFVSDAWDPKSGTTPPAPRKYRALWDTGATNTVITNKVATELGLPVRGTSMVGHAQGSGIANNYLVNIVLPNKVGVSYLRVSEGILGDIDVLIGMDIISGGDFAITNVGGRTTFSFRMPSVKEIDYELENHTPAKSEKISRNSDCHCGSGKKYKHCHGK